MDLGKIIDIFLHLDQYLNQWATEMGAWLYALLFAIVFAETGLVVTPFLPGDSLLFAVGALSATEGSPIDPWLVSALLIVAAILGDAVNYAIGARVGPKVFTRGSRFFKQEHLARTQRFYEKHGGKTIILARFAMFNVVGAVVWVVLFVALGHAFGNLPVVKRNFQYVILAIIVLSVLPIVFEWWRARRESRRA